MDPLDLVGEIGRLFDEVGIAWVLGGSMASSVSGQPRATMDVDMAVRMDLIDVVRTATQLGIGDLAVRAIAEADLG